MKIDYENHINLALITAIIINEDILGGTVLQTFAEEFQDQYAYDFNWENQEMTFDEAIIKFVKSKLK
jgi:hypothetical protein